VGRELAPDQFLTHCVANFAKPLRPPHHPRRERVTAFHGSPSYCGRSADRSPLGTPAGVRDRSEQHRMPFAFWEGPTRGGSPRGRRSRNRIGELRPVNEMRDLPERSGAPSERGCCQGRHRIRNV
jgi:hypothetical protein